MFIAALFTIAKCWIQPKGLSVNEWIEKLAHLHNGILCSRKKEGAPAFCNRMDGRGQQLFLKCLALRWLLYHHGSQGPHCGDPDSCPSRSLCCSHPRLLLSCWGCSSQGICIYWPPLPGDSFSRQPMAFLGLNWSTYPVLKLSLSSISDGWWNTTSSRKSSLTTLF